MLQRSELVLGLWEEFLLLLGVSCLCCCSFPLWWGVCFQTHQTHLLPETDHYPRVGDRDAVHVECTVWPVLRTGHRPPCSVALLVQGTMTFLSCCASERVIQLMTDELSSFTNRDVTDPQERQPRNLKVLSWALPILSMWYVWILVLSPSLVLSYENGVTDWCLVWSDIISLWKHLEASQLPKESEDPTSPAQRTASRGGPVPLIWETPVRELAPPLVDEARERGGFRGFVPMCASLVKRDYCFYCRPPRRARRLPHLLREPAPSSLFPLVWKLVVTGFPRSPPELPCRWSMGTGTGERRQGPRQLRWRCLHCLHGHGRGIRAFCGHLAASAGVAGCLTGLPTRTLPMETGALPSPLGVLR